MASPFLGEARGVRALANEPVDALRLGRVLLLGLLFGMFWMIALFGGERRRLGFGPWWLVIYAMIGMNSALYSPLPMISLWKGFEVLVYALAGVTIGWRTRDRRDVQDVLNVAYLGLWILLLSSLAGAVVDPVRAFPKFRASGPMAYALQGIFPYINANTLSQVSGMLAGISLCFALGRKGSARRVSYAIVFGVSFLCLVLSHSRTSLAALLVSGMLLVLFGRRWVVMLWGMLAGVLILLSGIGGDLTSGFQQYVYRGESHEVFRSMSGRLEFWPRVIEKIAEAPLLGHGLYASQRVILGGVATVDNTYLEVLLGVGTVGLLFFLMAVASLSISLWGAQPLRTRRAHDWRLVWVQQAILFLFLIMRSVTGPSFQTLHVSLAVFVLLLVLAARIRRMPQEEAVGEAGRQLGPKRRGITP